MQRVSIQSALRRIFTDAITIERAESQSRQLAFQIGYLLPQIKMVKAVAAGFLASVSSCPKSTLPENRSGAAANSK